MRMTPLAKLVEVKIGEPLQDFVVGRRNSQDAASRSWQSIADTLSERSGEVIPKETLRGWFLGELQVVLRDPDATPAITP